MDDYKSYDDDDYYIVYIWVYIYICIQLKLALQGERALVILSPLEEFRYPRNSIVNPLCRGNKEQ